MRLPTLFSLVLLLSCGNAQPPTPSEPAVFSSKSTKLPQPGNEPVKHAFDAGWSTDSKEFMFCAPDSIDGTTCYFQEAVESGFVENGEGVKTYQKTGDGAKESIGTYDPAMRKESPELKATLDARKAQKTYQTGPLPEVELIWTTELPTAPDGRLIETKFKIGVRAPGKEHYFFSDSINAGADFHLDALQLSPDKKYVAAVVHSHRSYELALFESTMIASSLQ